MRTSGPTIGRYGAATDEHELPEDRDRHDSRPLGKGSRFRGDDAEGFGRPVRVVLRARFNTQSGRINSPDGSVR